MEQPATSPSFVGIDVSKDRLDVHVRPSGQTSAVARDGKGLEQLTSELRDLAPALIVLEATGGFEITVAAALASAGLPLAVVNPRQIRDFARATGRPAKPTRSMLKSSPCSLNAFAPNHVRSRMPTARLWLN
jgi:transposase